MSAGEDPPEGPAAAGVPALHVVVPDRVAAAPGFLRTARELRERGAGSLALHLRVRGLTARRLHELAAALADDALRHGGWCVVNERVDVALTSGAGVVQLGRGALPVRAARELLGPGGAVGASVHSRAEALRAGRNGASFLLVGTIFSTPSHPERPPAGVERIEACRAADLPLVAIGGMRPDRVGAVVAAGAHGVATLSGVWDAPSPADAVDRFLDALREAG